MLLDDAVLFANLVLQQEAVQREYYRSNDESVKKALMAFKENLGIAKVELLNKYIRSNPVSNDKFRKSDIAKEIQSEISNQGLHFSEAAIKTGTLPGTLRSIVEGNFAYISVSSMQNWLDKLKG